MHIIVIGSGIIGVTTAYQLLRYGYEVSIIDRQSSPAMETSYGNAGLIAPGHSYSWATTSMSKSLFKLLYKNNNRQFRYKLKWDIDFWKWGIKFLKEYTPKKRIINNFRNKNFCIFSQKCFHELIDDVKIKYYENKNGLIYLFRSHKAFYEGIKKIEKLNYGVENIKILNKKELIDLEPSFKEIQSKICGGIYCISDESGNCKEFTVKLAKKCKKMGAKFHFNTNVKKFIKTNNHIKAIYTSKGEKKADIFVLACASNSSFLASQLGDSLPIYPIKGYSITVPVIDYRKIPIHSGIDEENRLVFTTLGKKMRFTSVAEISGYNMNHTQDDFTEIIENASLLFPNACDYHNIDYWSGLRPMTPNGSPRLGKGKMNNLYYNTGHGHLGWTMCAGSAQITADLIRGKIPSIDLDGMIIT